MITETTIQTTGRRSWKTPDQPTTIEREVLQVTGTMTAIEPAPREYPGARVLVITDGDQTHRVIDWGLSFAPEIGAQVRITTEDRHEVMILSAVETI